MQHNNIHWDVNTWWYFWSMLIIFNTLETKQMRYCFSISSSLQTDVTWGLLQTYVWNRESLCVQCVNYLFFPYTQELVLIYKLWRTFTNRFCSAFVRKKMYPVTQVVYDWSKLSKKPTICFHSFWQNVQHDKSSESLNIMKYLHAKHQPNYGVLILINM